MLPRVYFKAMKVQCNVTKPIYVHHGKTTAAEHAVPDYGIRYKFIVFRLSRLPLIFFAIVTNLCIFVRLIESPHLRLFNSSTTASLLPTHSTHTQPQQRTMRHYTINPAFKAFIAGVASVLFALWMVSNSLLKSVHSSLIPSQVKTHWWLLRHLQIPIRCRDA
jgi:hypothetical protein